MIDENQQKGVFRDEKTQQELNTPLTDSSGMDQSTEEFLKRLLDLIDSRKIDLMVPSTIINNDIYDQLTDEQKGKVDLDAVNMLGTIRAVKDLYDNGFKDTYQFKTELERLKLTKERLEDISGDVYII